MSHSHPPRIVMMGATGAVGHHCARTLATHPSHPHVTLLGRRRANIAGEMVQQRIVDVEDPVGYREHLAGHDAAICTVGVGEPTKMDKTTFVRIDKTLVLNFATACREAGIKHFSLLSSVGTSADSPSFYLRTKGELEDELRKLGFDRLSLFHPSMILTPTNRYGIAQAVTLVVWPLLKPVLAGPARKLRGVRVETLGRAIALNALSPGRGEETLEWDDFVRIVATAV